MKNGERQSNIELLRIVAMLGVIVLHYNNTEIGGAFLYASGINKVILYVLESIFICAVNLYMLISGYFMCNKNTRRFSRPLELLIQVMIFQLGFYVLAVFLGQKTFCLSGMLGSLVPNNYFVILYIVCFVVSPYINILLQKLDEKQSSRFLITMLIIFSVWPTAVDVLEEVTQQQWMGLSSIGIDGSQNGYTIVNFLLMYCIGAYLSMHMKKEYKYSTLMISFLVVAALVCIWAFLCVGYGIIGGSAWSYGNPLIIGEAVLLFLLFQKLPIKNNRMINTLAKGAFSVYLLHTPFLLYVRIPEIVRGAAGIMIGHIIVVSVVIYLICFVCSVIYEKIMGMFVRVIKTLRERVAG